MRPALVDWYVDHLKQARPLPSGFQATTVGVDSRFPNTNQTRHCYQMYIDYHRCVKKRGDKFEPCTYFKNAYDNLCPQFWVEKWDEQVENGTFAGSI